MVGKTGCRSPLSCLTEYSPLPPYPGRKRLPGKSYKFNPDSNSKSSIIPRFLREQQPEEQQGKTARLRPWPSGRAKLPSASLLNPSLSKKQLFTHIQKLHRLATKRGFFLSFLVLPSLDFNFVGVALALASERGKMDGLILGMV